MQTTGDGTTAAYSVYPRWEDGLGGRLLDRLTYRRVREWIDAVARRGLRVEVDRVSGRTVLSLQGRLDHQSAPVLKHGLEQIVHLAGKSIDVDLSGVDRVDGMGLASLVWAWRLTRDLGVSLRLLHVRPSVREIVAKMNLHHLLQIVEDREPLLLAQ